MKRLFRKSHMIPVWIVLCLVMLSAVPAFATGSDLSVKVSDRYIAVPDSGTFTFSIELDSGEEYRAADVGLFISDGVEITSVSIDNGASAIGPTEARGLIWFGYFSSQAAAGKTVLTVSGVCRGAGDWAVKVDSAKITHPDYSTTQVVCGLVVNLSRDAGAATTTTPAGTTTTTAPITETTPVTPSSTAPVTSQEPVTSETPATSEAPVTPSSTVPTTDTEPVTSEAPATSEAPVTPSSTVPTTDTEPVTSEAPATSQAPVPSSSTAPDSGDVPETSEAPTTTANPISDESPEAPVTGDVNVPLLLISCSVIAVIIAGALIYTIYRNKIRKGE